jgi:iron complex transport system substrate-binding protein
MRVVSLLPSATEIVCAVGARADLVGISHECDFPSGVERLPVLTRTRRALPRASAAIDRAVRELLVDALTVYELELDALREVRPELIVTQDLCDVCAVALDDVRAALRELAREDVRVLSLKPTRLADVWEDVRRVGRELGRGPAAESVAAELERRCAALALRAGAAARRPRVLSIEWLAPVMIGGTWMPELIEIAGGEALVTKAGQHAPTLTLAELEQLDPEVVLIKPCGFDLARSTEELALLREQLPWSRWSAVARGAVYLADGNAFFNRPGPRLVESAEILAACAHPGLFPELAAKHAGSLRRVRADLELEPVSPARGASSAR